MPERYLLVLAFVAAAAGHAQEVCPWLNSATAGGILGGDVIVQVTHSSANKADADCTFELQRGERVSRLVIEVNTMRAPHEDFPAYKAQCGQHPRRLGALGNEAVDCGGSEHQQNWQMIVGRVRDRAFRVRITTDEAEPAAGLRDEARRAADQVAGILF